MIAEPRISTISLIGTPLEMHFLIDLEGRLLRTRECVQEG
jgi:hypothetical protein